jgi:ornithine carbamoyltransferase
MVKNMLDFSNFSTQELTAILDRAAAIKKDPEKFEDILKGKKLYMLFEKTSTRTFLSFAAGITELGGSYYNQLWKDSNFTIGDPVSELLYVCRNVDLIMARLKYNKTVKLFGEKTARPFINGCDNTFHPCQALADVMTVKEHFGTYQVKMLYIGAKNNVLNSLVELFPRLGGKLYSYTPIENKTEVDADFYENAKKSGNYTELDPSMPAAELKKLVGEMEVVYTDTWVDMEFFSNPQYADYKEQVIKKMMPCQLSEELLDNSKAIVLHDMPMHIGYEISQGIADKNLEHILDQAENRRHAEKAVMVTLLWEDKMQSYFD